MTRVNTASITSQLQALGFSTAGAQQLIAAQVLSDARDRRRLALLLAGLFEAAAVQAAPAGGRTAMKTQSGVIIELHDGAGGTGGGTGGGRWAGASMAAPATTPVASRTASGIVVSFDDDA
jgi:hypothetical protein